MHLYDSTIPSGNGYKVHLILAHLGRPYETRDLDISRDAVGDEEARVPGEESERIR